MHRRLLAALLLSAGLTARSTVRASCERPLLAPLNPLGGIAEQSDRGVVGVLPGLLGELATRSGCVIQPRLVPRARLMQMFRDGQGADLSTGTAGLAASLGADFVALTRVRLSLIVERRLVETAPGSLAELLARPGWRGLHVRDAAINEALAQALARLEADHRLWRVRDWTTVLRMLLAGRAEFSIFVPSLLHGETAVMQGEARQRLVALPLGDLPDYEIGLMLSARLPDATRARLREQLQAMVREGRVREALRRAFPADRVELDFPA